MKYATGSSMGVLQSEVLLFSEPLFRCVRNLGPRIPSYVAVLGGHGDDRFHSSLEDFGCTDSPFSQQSFVPLRGIKARRSS
jgi:hypothetical protein